MISDYQTQSITSAIHAGIKRLGKNSKRDCLGVISQRISNYTEWRINKTVLGYTIIR